MSNMARVEGPRGGEAAGTAVEGPRGNEAGAARPSVPNGGVVAGRGVEGAGGGSVKQGIAAGPGWSRRRWHGRARTRMAVSPRAVSRPDPTATRPASRASRPRIAMRRRASSAATSTLELLRPRLVHRSSRRVVRGRLGGGPLLVALHVGRRSTTGSRSPIEQPIYYDYGNTVIYQDDGVYVDGVGSRHAARVLQPGPDARRHRRSGRCLDATATGCRSACFC